MNINKTITLGWEGEDYPLIITMRHTDHVEANGINLLAMVRDCAIGDLKISQATKLIAILLQSAGALNGSVEDDQEKVWDAMCENGEVGVPEIILLTSEILSVFFFRSKKKSTQKKPKKPKK